MTMGFFPVLALIFITLKLLGIIAWSWWWILAPIWLPFGLMGISFVGLVILQALTDSR